MTTDIEHISTIKLENKKNGKFKFYNLITQYYNAIEVYELIVHWGRIGNRGRFVTMASSHNSEELDKIINKILKSKFARGYENIEETKNLKKKKEKFDRFLDLIE
jgi:predicted DNA-binding WGR domain protein